MPLAALPNASLTDSPGCEESNQATQDMGGGRVVGTGVWGDDD